MMIRFTKTSKLAKQRYSEFTKLTNNELNVIRGGETPPEEDDPKTFPTKK